MVGFVVAFFRLSALKLSFTIVLWIPTKPVAVGGLVRVRKGDSLNFESGIPKF